MQLPPLDNPLDPLIELCASNVKQDLAELTFISDHSASIARCTYNDSPFPLKRLDQENSGVDRRDVYDGEGAQGEYERTPE